MTEQIRQWRAEAQNGPEMWRAALDRTIELVTPTWGDQQMVMSGPMLAQGGAALALGIYIIAREQNTPVDQVTRAQMETLQPRNWFEQARLWDTKLQALGHDPADQDDPTMARWRELSFDENPSGIDRDEWELGARSGPALGEALGYALAPRWNLAF